MKKLITLGLTLTTIATLGASIARAEVIDNLDGTQTLNNTDGKQLDTQAKIEYEGWIGEFDNTDPDSPEPNNPDMWVSVTLPTNAIFSSDKANDHKSIISPEHKVKNNSGRPVRVELEGFTSAGDAQRDIASLSLGSVNSSATVEVMNGGVDTGNSGTLMELDSPEAAIPVFNISEDSFVFTGVTKQTWQGDHKVESLKGEVTLNFVPLDEDGKDY